MQTQLQEISPVHCELRVEVPWVRVKEEIDSALGRLAKKAQVRGFRPGKVPRRVVEQVYRRQVHGEALGNIVQASLEQAIEKHDLAIVAQPTLDLPKVEEGRDLTFSAKLEVRPQITKVHYEGLAIEDEAAVVADDAVDSEIERLRLEQANRRIPEPMRPAQKGDELTISYTTTVNGKVEDKLSGQGYRLTLGREEVLPAIEKELLGAQPGDIREAEIEIPDDHPEESLRGHKAQLHIEIAELREVLLPELDDEFAKDCDAETLLELRLDIRKRLEEQTDQRVKSRRKHKIIDALVDANPIEAPPSLVEEQKRVIAIERSWYQRLIGVSPPDDNDAENEVTTRAERRVKASLLLGALSRQQGIAVGDDDIETHIQRVAQERQQHPAKLRAELADERRRAGIESQILEEKLTEFLRQHVKIEETATTSNQGDAPA